MVWLIGQRGGTIKLDVFIYDKKPSAGGVLTDPDSTPSVDIYDQRGTLVVSNSTDNIEHLGTGHYEYTYQIPETAPIGANWRIEWTAVVNGTAVVNENSEKLIEFFEVINQVSAPTTSDGFCSVEEAVKLSGLFVNYINETIGTGTGSITTFNIENYPIAKFSEKVYVDDVLQTRDADYTIDYEHGYIIFSTAPDNGAAIKMDFKKITGGLTNSDYEQYINFATEEIYYLTGTNYGDFIETTEYYDGEAKKQTPKDGLIYETSDPIIHNPDYIILDNMPVASISALEIYDGNGNILKSFDPDEYIFYSYGKVVFKSYRIPDGNKNIKVTYQYGKTETPYHVRKLTAITSAIQAFTSVSGGTYDNINSYSLGKLSVNKGDINQKFEKQLERLEKERERLIKLVGESMDLYVL